MDINEVRHEEWKKQVASPYVKAVGVMSIPVTISPHRPYISLDKNIPSGGKEKITGHNFNIAKFFMMQAPEIQTPQFVGVHNCLCITLSRPESIIDIMGISTILPVLPELKMDGVDTNTLCPVTWLGKIKSYPSNKGLKLYIPSETCSMLVSDYSKKQEVSAKLVSIEAGYKEEPLELYVLMIEKLKRHLISG